MEPSGDSKQRSSTIDALGEEFFLDAPTPEVKIKNYGVQLKITVPPIEINTNTNLIGVDGDEVVETSSSDYEENDFEDGDYQFSGEDESNGTNKSLDILCMSPPGVRVVKNYKTSTKHGRPKKSRLKKTKHIKRPSLVNSAFNLDIKDETNTLADSLTEIQDKYNTLNLDVSNSEINNDAVSAPVTSNDISKASYNLNDSKLQQQAKENNKEKPHVNTNNSSNISSRPPQHKEECYVDRREKKKQISNLLKLALKTKNYNDYPYVTTAPPATPATSLISESPMSSMLLGASASASPASQTGYSGLLASSSTTSSSSYPSNKTNPTDLPQAMQQKAENVWKHIYDFFEHYNDRTSDDDLIDRRLSEARASIPTTINQILNSNFYGITSYMNKDIEQRLKTPLDYSDLFESKVYIDQLCYLYFLVEEVINRIGLIESLYPSMRILRLSQPSYADRHFEGTTKTLLLWYKTMTELMSKSDVLGKFLGFAKRPEHLKYWTWFDQRLNNAQTEYNNVQNWLDSNFSKNSNNLQNNNQQNTSALHNSSTNNQNIPNATNKTSNNNNLSATKSQSANNTDHSPTTNLTTSSTQTSASNNNTNNASSSFNDDDSNNFTISQAPAISKQCRQVSFELHASKSTAKDLLYNNFEDNLSQSVIEAGDLTYNMSSTGNTGNNTDDDFSSQRNYLSNLSVDSVSQNDNDNNNNNNSLLATASNFQSTFLSNKSDCLKPAKLHHLNSFVSRTSLSNGESPGSGSLSSSIYSSMLNMAREANPVGCENVNVGFSLNDSNISDMESQYMSANASPEPEKQPESINKETAEKLNELSDQQKQNSEAKDQRQKIFKEFLHKRLRKHGLTKTCEEITKIIMSTLPHVLTALQIDHCERQMFYECEQFNYHLMPLHRKCREYMAKFPYDEETVTYGVRGEWFQKLDLPTFRPLYLFLASVILELMHMCVKMQIHNKRDMKKQSNFNFSLLSIEVLTHECRECIEQAILVRQFYYHLIYSVFERKEINVQQAIENDLVQFDDDLKEIIDIYLGLVTDWVHDLVAACDTTRALYVLKDEWNFCKNNLYFVMASEDIYAKRFCTMCSSVNESLVHILNDIDHKHKQPLMEYIENMEMLQDMTENWNSFECDSYDEGQLNSMPVEQNPGEEQTSDSDANVLNANSESETSSNSMRRKSQFRAKYDQKYYNNQTDSFDVNLKCNEFKEAINEVRKRCMKALSFCGSLVGDLELAAKYNVRSKIQELLDELKASNHVLVVFTNPELQSFNRNPNSSASSFEPPKFQNEFPYSDTNEQNHNRQSFMIFVPHEFAKDKTQIARLLFIISAKDDGYTTNMSQESSKINGNNGSNNGNGSHNLSANYSNLVRRLSSSNSFFEVNDLQRNLNKLNMHISHMNNLTRQKQVPQSATPEGSTFIFSPHVSTDGYLLYLQLPRKTKSETLKWNGATTKLWASMPVRRSLYQHKNNVDCSVPATLILVVASPQILKEKRLELKKRLKDSVMLSREKTSFHPNIEYAIDDLKDSILNLRKESVDCIIKIEKDLKNTVHYDIDQSNSHTHHVIDQRYLSEIWRVSYNFGIELQSECVQFMTQDRAEQFSLGLADFCIKWCEYIVDKTERGKGRTVQPWAANKGIQLMKMAYNHSENINDTVFKRLNAAVEKCILHVIGGRNNNNNNNSQRPANEYMDNSSLKTSISQTNTMSHENISNIALESHLRSSESQLYQPPLLRLPSNTKLSQKDSNSNLQQLIPPKERFSRECERTDKDRERNLLEKRYIGKILDQQRTQHVITATEVNFSWQLGLLIGEGQYGKVYSCVNLDNGEPMAMKEIPFKSNDVKTISDIANEINNLQGIDHENLVKLYGAELHRKEILIFMEFCGDQCTLDRISRETSGLPEKIVRNYTKSLLRAVDTLHENGVMHRDIKGANIFLKAVDPKHPEKIVLKLGDFGCSIKFKDTVGTSINTRAKATGFMGTFPFMAPEVMVCGGAVQCEYTYSADIWSLGCVVIEMFMGKRPWHPFPDESILFQVHITGTQKRPPYPAQNISNEAINFLDKCFEFNPNDRLTADQLLDHPFVKVSADDQYSSL